MITELGGPVIIHGKYEGRTVMEVAVLDPVYILEHAKELNIPQYVVRLAHDELEGESFSEDEDDNG